MGMRTENKTLYPEVESNLDHNLLKSFVLCRKIAQTILEDSILQKSQTAEMVEATDQE